MIFFNIRTKLDKPMLHDMSVDRGCTLLDWNKREKIILAVARVLVYLHQHDVVHNNVKPRNILLDENFHPKLSDFGLARFLPIKEVDCVQVDAIIHQANQLSTKDDVYGFGVLILEIMIGYNKDFFEGLQTVSMIINKGSDSMMLRLCFYYIISLLYLTHHNQKQK